MLREEEAERLFRLLRSLGEHDDGGAVAVAQQHFVGETLHVGTRERLDSFEITGAVVLVPAVFLLHESLPVAVVALLLFVLLDLETLHFFEFVGTNTVFGQFVQVLLHEQEHGVALFGSEGGEDLERVGVAHTVVERCVGVYGIGHTAVFANGLEVALGEDLSEGIGSHSVLEGVGLFAVPELNEHGLRAFEFTLETIHEHARARTNAEVGVSFALLHAGKRCDVLLAEGAKRIFVECSDEVEIKSPAAL